VFTWVYWAGLAPLLLINALPSNSPEVMPAAEYRLGASHAIVTDAIRKVNQGCGEISVVPKKSISGAATADYDTCVLPGIKGTQAVSVISKH
jgi:hypothetical protein